MSCMGTKFFSACSYLALKGHIIYLHVIDFVILCYGCCCCCAEHYCALCCDVSKDIIC